MTVSAGACDGDTPTVGQCTCVTASESTARLSRSLLPVASGGTDADDTGGDCEAL